MLNPNQLGLYSTKQRDFLLRNIRSTLMLSNWFTLRKFTKQKKATSSTSYVVVLVFVFVSLISFAQASRPKNGIYNVANNLLWLNFWDKLYCKKCDKSHLMRGPDGQPNEMSAERDYFRCV